MKSRLGVNIDHVATLRQARGTRYPEPLYAAMVAQDAGADNITLHLREDRRHIQERDLYLLKEMIQTRINLEMALTPEMLAIALKVCPAQVCLVPEKREELTTEGGLDVITHFDMLKEGIIALKDKGIAVSLFIASEDAHIETARELGADIVELHTGTYADSQGSTQGMQYKRLQSGATLAQEIGLTVDAGHGLHYHNVQPVAAIPEIDTLNIGHAIIAKSIFVGLDAAVREMKALIREAS